MKDDRVYLAHVLDAIARLLDYTREGKDAFRRDPKTQDAVVRNIEIVGEAVKRISPALKTRHADVPWKRIAGMRDKVIHEYFGVNLDIVWSAVERELPALKKRVEEIMRTEPGK
ncbi:MAG: DUF86 domain-containing protein [Elusimicrobia bacterium]|nr:DUF86 domain-containing protein [Elusimicrobiota bacterium]